MPQFFSNSLTRIVLCHECKLGMELSCSEEESKSERVQRYKKMRSNGICYLLVDLNLKEGGYIAKKKDKHVYE